MGRAQIAVLGFSRREIEVLVRTRRLIRVHRGVYAVGHEVVSDRGRMIAALLGYTVVRFTWRQVIHETLLVTVRIAQLLTGAVV